MSQPLSGLRIIELAGLGPAPHATMLMGDLGADVVRIARDPGPHNFYPEYSHALRSRRTVRGDLKDETFRDEVIELVTFADVLIEGFRPGVAERLGLGPADCQARNPQLIYGRMTGWGQNGPLAPRAGHDINYIGITGALAAVGTETEILPPINFVGDYGGGSMFLVMGVLSALWGRQQTGKGDVVDAAIVDGTSALLQPIYDQLQAGWWVDERASNVGDGGAPYYRTYACSDGRFIAVGSIEQQFYDELLTGLGLTPEDLPNRNEKANWATLTDVFAAIFSTESRDHWAAVFADLDACVTPVLTFLEAPRHPHMVARRTIVGADAHLTAAPAPRFGSSPEPDPPGMALEQSMADALKAWRS